MNPTESARLLPWQRRLLVWALVCLAGACIVFTLLGLGWAGLRFLDTFSDVFLPLAIAAILATLLRVPVEWAAKHLRLGRTGAIFLLYGGVLATLLLTLYWIVPLAIRQTQDFVSDFPSLLENLKNFLATHLPAVAAFIEEEISGKLLTDLLGEVQKHFELAFEDIGEGALQALGVITEQAGAFLGKVAAYAVIPVYCFFLLNKPSNPWSMVETQLSFLPDERRADVLFLARV